MKHKYSIVVNEDKNQLIIKEYGELDKEILSLLCEETYARDALVTAAETGKSALINQLRTPNLYPPVSYINRIADAVMEIVTADNGDSDPRELNFDDLEQLSRDEAAMLVGDIEDESEDLDGLLEDEVDDGLGDKLEVKSIKVADDDGGDADSDG